MTTEDAITWALILMAPVAFVGTWFALRLIRSKNEDRPTHPSAQDFGGGK